MKKRLGVGADTIDTLDDYLDGYDGDFDDFDAEVSPDFAYGDDE